MPSLIATIERALKIDSGQKPESLMRIRAVWAIGLTIILTQFINMGVMAFTYGRWTYDHSISIAGCTAVLLLIFLVRWYKNTVFYAAAYGALLIAAVTGSALPEHSGINAAFVPFVALGPMLGGFMAGRRVALAIYAAALLLLGFLYWVSISNAPIFVAGDYVRETNRLAQSVFALTLSAVISVFVCDRTYMLLSDIREAADRAQRAEAAKSEFIAMLSHELRTPLNGVIGLADVLTRSAHDARERHLAETIVRSGEGLLRILNDLLDLSSLDAGKLAFDPRPVSPREIVRHVADAWRETASKKGLSLTATVDKDVPDTILADDLRVTQILQNLVSNAVKFTGEGQVLLKVGAFATEDGRRLLEFRVKDTGRGVPADLAERIFDRFDQGAPGTARRYGGTGLGLPICRELARLMGGSVTLAETSEHGSTFLLTLPTTVSKDGAPTVAKEAAAA